MAPKSAFSKGRKGFVDHKWSKISFDASLAFLSSFGALPRISVGERFFVKPLGRYRRFAAKNLIIAESSTLLANFSQA
jgi:hypothetical protein